MGNRANETHNSEGRKESAMPQYLFRCTQKVAFGKWDDKLEQEKKYLAAETRLGAPAVRQYRALIGGDILETYVKEWEYDSLAEMEQAFQRFSADPEWQALGEENDEQGIALEHQYEVFQLISL
jgi:hypothetical protein